MKLNLSRPINLLPFPQRKHAFRKVAEGAPQATTPINLIFFSKFFGQFSPHFIATETLSQFFTEVSFFGETLYKSMTRTFPS